MNVYHWTLLFGFLAGANFIYAVQFHNTWVIHVIACLSSLAIGYQTAMTKTRGLSHAVSGYITTILAMHGIKDPDLPHEKKELRTP
jgi:predicted esterase